MKNEWGINSPSRFSKVAEDWLLSVSTHVKPTTVAAYNTIIKKHIQPTLGNMPPRRITDAVVEDFKKELATTPMSPATQKNIMHVLHATVRFARRYGATACDESFKGMAGVRPCDVPVLSDAEQNRIVSALGQNPDGKGLGVLICMYTGLRVGEICGLRWGDIDADCRSLSVRRTVSRMRCAGGTALYVGEPKSLSSRRRIPLPATLAPILEISRGIDDHYVVTDSPKRIPEPRNMQRYFSVLQSMAGVQPVKFHALRHTFATRCVELGFDVKALSMILGHSNVSITLNTYVHPSFERLKTMMELLD